MPEVIADDDLIIEVDDTPVITTDPLKGLPPEVEEPADKEVDPAKKPVDKGVDGGDDEDEDLGDYGDKVRKRINKEVWKRRELERKTAALEAQLQQASQAIQQFQQRSVVSDDYAVHAKELQIKAELDRVERVYKAAYDVGDTDEMFKTTTRIAELSGEMRQVDDYKQQRQQQPQRQQPVQQQAQYQGPDNKAVEWASQNEWFGSDVAKTGAAYALDAQLKSEGIDPRSDRYYEELDKRLHKEFPTLGGKAPEAVAKTKPSQAVAGVVRNSSDKRTVRLSPTEVAMAEKLGVPLAEYARYKK